MAPTTRVAAVQASSVGFDLAASVEKVAKLVSEAKSNGAQLVVLPEAFLSAYPRHWGFAIGARTEEQRQWFANYVSVSLFLRRGGCVLRADGLCRAV